MINVLDYKFIYFGMWDKLPWNNLPQAKVFLSVVWEYIWHYLHRVAAFFNDMVDQSVAVATCSAYVDNRSSVCSSNLW